MNRHAFGREIRAAEQRIAVLEREVSSAPAISRALAELHNLLDEFQVASDELQRRNTELAAVRATADTERERYQALFNFAPDGYVVTDLEGLIQEANHTAAMILLSQPGFLVGKRLIGFVAERDREAFHIQLEWVVERGGVHNWDLWLQPQDGIAIPVEVTVTTVRRSPGADRVHGVGQPIGLRWMLRDATERYWMQQKLQHHERELEELVAQRTAELTEANEQLRREIEEGKRREAEIEQQAQDLALINQVNDAMNRGTPLQELATVMVQGLHELFHCVGAAVYLLSEDGEYLMEQALSLSGTVMEAIEGLTGVKRPRLHIPVGEPSLHGEVIRTRRPSHFNEPPLVDQLMSEYFEAVPGDTLRRLVRVLVPRITALLAIRSVMVAPLISDGECVGLVVVAHTKSLTDGDLGRLEGMAKQVTSAIRHGRVEEALRQSEAHYHGLFEGVPIGLYRTTPAGQILDANPALVQMLGYADREALLAANVTEFYSEPQERRRWQELIAQEGMLPPVELQFRRADGRLIWVRDAARAVRDTAGQVAYYEGSIEDISDWRRAQDALVQAEKLGAANKLGASVAHEINNPLQAVIGCLGLAREAAAQEQDVERYLEVADSELHRVVRTVARLRDLTRPVSGQEKRPTDLECLLGEVLALTEPWCEERCVDLAFQMAETVPLLPLAGDQIQQAFLNLVLNAVDAMPDGGRLDISLAPTHQPCGARISFRDTGTGVAPDALPYIFEPFFTTKPEGMGLGLYVVQSTIHDHGGHIEVDSTVGEGATFAVWLPA